MSEGFVRVTAIGNLGADPEMKYSQGGNAVMRMRIACNERYKTREGERAERCEWVTIVFFGNRAEGLSKHLSKGMRVYVEGRLQTRDWEDRDGNKRYTTEVVGTSLLFLDSRRDGGERRSEAPRGGGDPQVGPPIDDFGEDDIPFAVNVVEHDDPVTAVRCPARRVRL